MGRSNPRETRPGVMRQRACADGTKLRSSFGGARPPRAQRTAPSRFARRRELFQAFSMIRRLRVRREGAPNYSRGGCAPPAFFGVGSNRSLAAQAQAQPLIPAHQGRPVIARAEVFAKPIRETMGELEFEDDEALVSVKRVGQLHLRQACDHAPNRAAARKR